MTSYRNSSLGPAIMQGSPPVHLVPRSDWDRPPWNRWSFQHVRELVPTAEIWRGTGPIWHLSRADQDLDGLELPSVKGETRTLAALLDETYTDGFIVLHKGRIVYERYFNGMDARSLHLSQSVAKSFTGVLAGILTERGEIDTEALVTHYVPELEKTAYHGALVSQLLDMTTGVCFDETYTDPYSDVGQMDVACGWKDPPSGTDLDFPWPHHVFELIMRLRNQMRPHGEIFDYRSVETDVLAFCLERATGKRLPQLFSEELWQPLGMEQSACITLDPAGYGLADGGMNVCLRDYARLGQAMLEGGRGVIPARWIEETRHGNHRIFGEPYTLSLPEGAYRNQWWIEDPRSRSLMARGVFGQMIYVNWDYGLVAAKLSSWPEFLNTGFAVATAEALHHIGRVMTSR